MKTRRRSIKICCAILAFLSVMGFTAASALKTKAEADAKTVTGAIVVGANIGKIIGGINSGLNLIRSIEYGINHSDGSFSGFWEHSTAYLSGNLESPDEDITKYDLEKMNEGMTSFFNQTKLSVEQLQTGISNVQASVDALNAKVDELADEVVKQADKKQISDFYQEYFLASKKLNDAYNTLLKAIEQGENEETVRSMYDNLYLTTEKLESLRYYITGEISVESILDVYDRYVNPTVDRQKCVDFALELYQVDSLQRYCRSLCYLYQIATYEKEVLPDPEGKINGYHSGDVTVYAIDFERNVREVNEGQVAVAAAIAKNLYSVYGLKNNYEYEENGEIYRLYANVNGFKAYNGSKIMLKNVPDELLELFDLDFTFSSADEKVKVTDSGVAEVLGESGTFSVTLEYGKGDLETPIKVAEYTFAIVQREFSGGGFGTSSAPYLIKTAEDLQKFNSNASYYSSKYFRLANDVEVTWNWVSRNFGGNFDGAGRKITGLKSAFVDRNSGTIQNLTIDSASINISGRVAVGILANYNSNLIANCHVKNSVVSASLQNTRTLNSNVTPYPPSPVSENTGNYCMLVVGGICGSNTSKIEFSSASSNNVYGTLTNPSISAPSGSWRIHNEVYLGGISGWNGGRIENCLAGPNSGSGTVNAYASSLLTPISASSNVYAGGIVGVMRGGTIKNAYSATPNFNRYFSCKVQETGGLHTYGAHPKHTANFVSQNIYGLLQSGTTENLISSTSSGGATAYTEATEEQKTAFKNQGWIWNDGYSPTLGKLFTSFTVNQLPAQRTYDLGETVNTAGISFAYSPFFEYNLPFGYTLSPVDTSTVGEKTVTLNLDGLTAEYVINVVCSHKGSLSVLEGTEPSPGGEGLTSGLKCDECGEILVEQTAIPAIVYEYAEPTWEWNGVTATATFVCLNDETQNKSLIGIGIPKTVKKATCAEKGLKVYTAIVAFNDKTYTAKKSVEIEMEDHTHVNDVAVAPTCETDGKNPGSHCKVCNAILFGNEVIPALGHDYLEPTWTWENGSATATFVCSRNENHGETKTATVTVKTTSSPTCETDGSRSLTATVEFDGKTFINEIAEKILAKGHTVVTTQAVPPTCLTGGYTQGSHCSVCNTVFESPIVIPSTGHDYNFSAWVWDENKNATATFVCALDGAHVKNIPASVSSSVTLPSGCTTEGERTYSATLTFEGQTYSNNKTVPLPALGHSPVVDKRVEPTCEETGLTQGSHCGVCNAVLEAQTSVKPLGHDYSSHTWLWRGSDKAEIIFVCVHNVTHTLSPAVTVTGEVTTPAGCVTEGVKTYTATAFFNGQIYTDFREETVLATGHKVVVDEERESTCSKHGLTEGSHCATCGEVFVKQEESPLKEHEKGDWQTVVAPQVGKEGKEQRACVNCGEVLEERVIQPLKETPSSPDSSAPQSPDQNSNKDNKVGCGGSLNSASVLTIALPCIFIVFIQKKKRNR